MCVKCTWELSKFISHSSIKGVSAIKNNIDILFAEILVADNICDKMFLSSTSIDA